MTRKGTTVLARVAVAAAGAGLAVAACGTAAPHMRTATATGSQSGPGYSWYHSMMGRYYHGMMMGGGSSRWMMGRTGYRWMMGGAQAPGWMRGGRLPGTMMGASTDPGKIMGRLWANAPGPRVSPATAARLGGQTPAGATIDRAHRRIRFTATSVRLAVLGSPPGGPDETFRIAGLVNPTVIVPASSRVQIEVINADPDTAHGLAVTASSSRPGWMPMMTESPAFAGSALWFLGNPTAAGMHAGTLTFAAAAPGTYRYLCPVPGHAQKGMAGTFIVRAGK